MISVITFTLIPMKSIWWRVFITFILFFSMGLCENFYQTKEYNRQFIIVHVLMIFLLSLFGGFLYNFHPFSSYDSFWMEKGTDIQILRMLLVLYMVLNLIFVPLITICVKHYLWKRDSMRNLENVCLQIEAED